jgi:branched-chain amino acid transport system ATP-binding protein
VVERLFAALERIRDQAGLTIILVEQRVDLALAFASEVLVLDRGRAVFQGTSSALRTDEAAKIRLFGVNSGARPLLA